MWHLIRAHWGLSSIKIVDGKVIETWESLRFMVGWSIDEVRFFCKKKDLEFEERVEVVSKPKRRRTKKKLVLPEPIVMEVKKEPINDGKRKYQMSRQKKIA